MGSCRLGKCTFRKLPLGKLSLGKMPLGKYLTPMLTVLLNYQYAQSPVWMEKISGKIKNGEN